MPARARIVFDDTLIRLTEELSRPDIWDDPKRAISISKKFSRTEEIQSAVEMIREAGEFLILPVDDDVLDHVEFLISTAKRLLSNDSSKSTGASSTLIVVRAGVGGLDAQDWAKTVFDSYFKWAERSDFEPEIVDEREGTHGGIRSSSLLIQGDLIHLLANEAGAHKVCHMSRFGDGRRRQTSMCHVDVLPVFDEPTFELDMQDVEITAYAASGPGGQHRNRKLTAIRARHLPTGIEAHSAKRSQDQNKKRAIQVLAARVEAYEKDKESRGSDSSGPVIGRAGRVRTWSLWPEKRVVDERSGYRSNDVDGLLAGDLDELIRSNSELVS